MNPPSRREVLPKTLPKKENPPKQEIPPKEGSPKEADLIKTLRQLPKTSGIYQYYDQKGLLLYVGKAKNLSKRIRSYFRSDASPNPNLSPRIAHMVSQIHSIQTLLAPNESEALILENSLIKTLKPRYNILLRDDKTYPYICIDMATPFPRPQITRIKKPSSASMLYFGPFCHGAREILESLYEFFPLVQRSGCLKQKQACLFYQIQRCPAPCERKISPETYATILQDALLCLKDKTRLLKLLEDKMLLLASQERFEEALALRERIKKIQTSSLSSDLDTHARDADWDIFAIACEGHFALLLKLYMREGKIISSDWENIPLNAEIQHNDLLSLYQQAILSHYSQDLPLLPKALILPQDLPQEEIRVWQQWLGARVKILTPQRGIKHKLIQMAILNAQAKLRSGDDEDLESKIGLQRLMGLKILPHRIEVFDTSHHAGTNNVGGMVVYEDSKWLKSSYRHYHLKGSDEMSQMREMLSRRAKDFDRNPPPDLWLLDGGWQQIRIAQEVLDSVGVELDIIAIAKEKHDHKAQRAKGKARDVLRGFLDQSPQELSLLPSDARLQLCQKLRDEAHRFALSFHRKQKLKSFIPPQKV